MPCVFPVRRKRHQQTLAEGNAASFNMKICAPTSVSVCSHRGISFLLSGRRGRWTVRGRKGEAERATSNSGPPVDCCVLWPQCGIGDGPGGKTARKSREVNCVSRCRGCYPSGRLSLWSSFVSPLGGWAASPGTYLIVSAGGRLPFRNCLSRIFCTAALFSTFLCCHISLRPGCGDDEQVQRSRRRTRVAGGISARNFVVALAVEGHAGVSDVYVRRFWGWAVGCRFARSVRRDIDRILVYGRAVF